MKNDIAKSEATQVPGSDTYKYLLWAGEGIGLAALFGIILGTFFDLKIDQFLYSPDNLFWRILSALGMFPFLALFVFYLGSITRQVSLSSLSKNRKMIALAISSWCGISTAAISAWSMCRSDSLGILFPQVVGNIPVIGAFAILIMVPIFFVGFFLAKKEYDGELLRQLIGLCVTLTIALACMEALKLFFCRPRYRLILQEIPGVTFTPWYHRFSGSAELIAKYGIKSNDFKSFPSGHTIFAMSLIYALPPLAEITGRKNKQKLMFGLFAAGALFAIFVAISRMFLGAHFLSDISMGAALSAMFAINLFRYEAKHNHTT